MECSRPLILPQAFLDRMKQMLGKEYDAFLRSYENPRTFGLRVNTAKISCEAFEEIVPFPVERIPWIKNGYFYKEESHPARCPLYQAGLYYLQEPSAMTPASRLPVKPGEYVLDLCAAPGGKATALGASLDGQGFLAANDISTSRARALLRNLELFGIPNLFVANESPDKLVNCFPEFFQKIILDAPCSGEGMFRKEEALARDWTPQKSRELAKIQRRLILQAADMLRPGGLLLYSTCTFAPEEDEGTVSYLLGQRPDMELTDMEGYEGFCPGVPEWGNGEAALAKCVRIFPHKMDGEGHFMALFKKKGAEGFSGKKAEEAPPDSAACTKKALLSVGKKTNARMHKKNLSRSGGSVKLQAVPDKGARQCMESFFTEIGVTALAGQPFDWSRVEIRGEKVYYLPPLPCEQLSGISFLRNGLYLGDLKKNRFEPSQPLALALRKGEAQAVISLDVTDGRLARYLKGETISIRPGEAAHEKGWHLLTVQGYPLGFGKLVGGVLKNKYPAGWRI